MSQNHPGEYYNQQTNDYEAASGAGFIWFMGRDHLSPMTSNADEFALESSRWREAISFRVGALLDELGAQPEDVVIDLGSGIGGPARDLYRTVGRKIVGLNVSLNQLQASQKISRQEGIDGVGGTVADVRNMPFADESVSHAYSINMLYHVGEPEKVFDELKRVLKPGGFIALEDWFLTDVITPEELKKLRYNWSTPEGEDTFHDFGEILDKLHDSDMGILETRDFTEESGDFLTESRFGDVYDNQVAPILMDAFPKLYVYDGYRAEHSRLAVSQLRSDVLFMGELYRSRHAVYRQIIAQKKSE